MEFEWDSRKAEINYVKHGVTFREATTVFGDPLSVVVNDPEHSRVEERYLIVGMSLLGRLIIVAFTDRGERIRIISARELTRSERDVYERGEF